MITNSQKRDRDLLSTTSLDDEGQDRAKKNPGSIRKISEDLNEELDDECFENDKNEDGNENLDKGEIIEASTSRYFLK